MAQGVNIGAWVLEGNVLEFHIVFVVVPLFHRQGALVHLVGDVQIRKGPFQVAAV